MEAVGLTELETLRLENTALRFQNQEQAKRLRLFQRYLALVTRGAEVLKEKLGA